MHLLKPTALLKSVNDITIELLERLNTKVVLLDVDNTLAHQGSQKPFLGVIDWSYKIRKSGISIVIVSNNFKKRVEPFAKIFDLQFVSFALKPFPVGFNKARKKLNIKSQNILVVGDQVFTDVLGANLAGMKSILLEPCEKEVSIMMRLKRNVERPLREKWKNEM